MVFASALTGRTIFHFYQNLAIPEGVFIVITPLGPEASDHLKNRSSL
jgi:hypothetical protein